MMYINIEEMDNGNVILNISNGSNASSVVLSRQELYEVMLKLQQYFEEGDN